MGTCGDNKLYQFVTQLNKTIEDIQKIINESKIIL